MIGSQSRPTCITTIAVLESPSSEVGERRVSTPSGVYKGGRIRWHTVAIYV